MRGRLPCPKERGGVASKSSLDAKARDRHGTYCNLCAPSERALRADRLFAERSVHPLGDERNPPPLAELPSLLEAQIEPEERREARLSWVRRVGRRGKP